MREPSESPRRPPWPAFLATVMAVMLLDIISKMVVVRYLGPDAGRQGVEVLPSYIEFTSSENSGIAFGLLRGNSTLVWMLVVAALAGTALFVVRTISTASRALAIVMGLVAGGGLANLINRIANGHVIDFLELWRWPSFNLADASITLGVIALLVLLVRQESLHGR